MMMLCIYDPDDHRDELEGMIEELGGWVMAFGEDLMRKNTECWNLLSCRNFVGSLGS